MQLIEVAFRGNRKDFFLWESDDPPPLKAAVIVDADRGEDLGVVHAHGELAQKRNAGTPHGYGEAGTTKKVRRLATPDEVKRAEEMRGMNEDARRRAMERVKSNALVMKLSDAEWQWDRKKLTLYFTADKRVDFRTLVRELASMFRTRIELKQIGVRDEAKRLDGIGRCGRQYCSASWLPELRPVNLGVAKDQRLSLNPSQISGACGRLMCCLRYEHEFYVQSRKRFPKEGRLIKTSRGEEKVISNDIFRERVVLRGEDGEVRTILLTELRAEADAAGTPLPVVAPAPQAQVSDERDDGDEIREPEEEELVSDEIIVADENAPDVVESVASPQDPTADERERRPNRRRGRRGGRRNRPGGRGPRNGPTDSTPPTQGGDS
ncbi:MAG TPA: regulatory iron-sulfur-containing complex subunit RicT [Gemmatimonadaceae bacterium]|nr:regulatory iron-sulfur-containing complex subunit RicT [Gemmatimonadaceae bacterium]